MSQAYDSLSHGDFRAQQVARRQHHVPHPKEESETQATLGVSLGERLGELFSPKSLFLHQRYGERIAQGQCHARARGGRYGVGASLLPDPAIEDDRSQPRERGVDGARDGNDRDAQPLE